MAEITTIARPYAKAAFTHARAAQARDAAGAGQATALAQWGQMLSLAAAVVAEPKMAAFLARPQLTATQQADALIAVCGDQLNAAAGNFIRQLCGNRRIFVLAAIRDQFAKMVAELQKLGEITVVSAFPMSDAQTTKVTASLQQRFAQDVHVSVEVDSTLMGGIVVRFGDLVIDASVRGRLNKLASTLNS